MDGIYQLHDSQYRVFNDPARFIVLAAGRRFGKTILAVVRLLHEAVNRPNMRCWYIAPYYRQAKSIAWDMMLRLIPKEIIASKNETELEIRLKNGSEICLKGADNEDSLVGVGLNYVVLDEFALQKPGVWEKIVRPMLTDTLGKAMFISTPRGKNHFWDLFIKGERKEFGYSSYKFGTEHNPYIERSEIKEAKEQLADRYFRQEYLASFEDYTGMVYPEFNSKTHVVAPFEIPAWWEKVGTIDPAMSGTTACLFGAIDENQMLYIFGEYYEQNRRASEVSDAIRGKCSRWYIDPASQIRTSVRQGNLYSLFDEYADNGVYPICAENDVFAGINRVAEYFKNGRVKIFASCKNLIAELERYHWAEERETISGVVQPKPYKAFDHAVDCLRYLIMSRSHGSKEPKPRSKDRAMPLAGELLENAPKDSYKDWMN